MPKTFTGGVHPLSKIHEGKLLTMNSPVREEAAQQIIMPMIQNIGAYCTPLVKKDDYIRLGQKIGEPMGFVSAPIHSSVSGRVLAVEPRSHVSGVHVMSVVIENDGQDTLDDSVQPIGTVEELPKERILKAIFDAGLVGMGGATFPTHVKTSVKDFNVDTVILNGAECEPYLTVDYRLMYERPEQVADGLKALMKAVDVQKGVVGIEDNKPEAIARMEKALEDVPGASVCVMPTKYPQGAEKQLIQSVTGREVPSGKLPAHAGVLVFNVGTAGALSKMLRDGLPLVKRMVTVSGAVENPSNLLLRIGTTFQDAIQFCGGYKGMPGKVLSGGPMMGFPVYDTNAAITKGTSGILVLTEKEATLPESGPCIRCGRCAEACPIGLEPMKLCSAYEFGRPDLYETYSAQDCIECGCCTYSCPANRHITHSIKLAKRQLAAAKKK